MGMRISSMAFLQTIYLAPDPICVVADDGQSGVPNWLAASS